jgi:hypothetical protein
MECTQLLIASLIVLVICLVVWFLNNSKGEEQPVLLQVAGVASLLSTLYFYSKLEKHETDCLWGIVGGNGGAYGGAYESDASNAFGGAYDDDDDESLIVALKRTP